MHVCQGVKVQEDHLHILIRSIGPVGDSAGDLAVLGGPLIQLQQCQLQRHLHGPYSSDTPAGRTANSEATSAQYCYSDDYFLVSNVEEVMTTE